MQAGARAAAAIAVLTDMDEAKRPVKLALQAWGRTARYAGARDRAAVSGLVLDTLRHRLELTEAMGDTARGLVIGTLGRIWGQSAEAINSDFAASEHAPAPLSTEEQAGLLADTSSAAAHVQANVPAWIWPFFEQAFGDNALAEARGLNTRAPVDLRLNTLKRPTADGLKSVVGIGAEAVAFLPSAARIPPPSADTRSPHVQSLPGYVKGWLEIQDAGSQFVTLCTGIGPGMQVLDYCAGGGGKTLALAQQMQNKGQIFAYDNNNRRLAPIHERLKRAGVRNAQVRSPSDPEALADLTGNMHAVLVDAPCTGTGTWRRHPDLKWRLREGQLQTRIGEQDEVLRQAAPFVRPGGVLFYVTCSLLRQENEDRIDEFLAEYSEFSRVFVAEIAASGGLLNAAGQQVLAANSTETGDLRLSPMTTQTDGFYMAALRKNP